uniref:NADH-ubiquinone oxidoreductase chain 4 n=1 Tax=Pupa strigosa TaxID=96460 RepID=Q9T9F8_9GAST|nr:NADH dehydrogenase subunit 4 [Pupa strigosa]BAA89025.1 ND4 [Pupa strigosa]
MVVCMLSMLVCSLIFLNWGSIVCSLVVLGLLSLSSFAQFFSNSSNLGFWDSSVASLMIFLSCVLCYLALHCTSEEKSPKYVGCILLLTIFLLGAFSSSNIMMFYLFFEASLIPTLGLIITWGYQPERLQAGSYMMLYTVGASLPLLIVILWHSSSHLSMDLTVLSMVTSPYSGLVMFIIFGAFLVKLPIYSAHLWLPKAHVEAPLAGSMLLAGILLKLGGYGLLVMSSAFNFKTTAVAMVLYSVILWGGLLATLMCLRQVDVKALVAFSSVGHMSIVAVGVLSHYSWGVMSGLVTMVAHGFSSSALFCLAYYTYNKSHTRNLGYMKGMLVGYPVLSLWWFVFCCINMAAPPTLNLLGELSVLPVLWNMSLSMAVVMALMVFFSASYNMFLYSTVNHGAISSYLSGGTPLKTSHSLGLMLHSVPLALILKCQLFWFSVWSESQCHLWITKSVLYI